MSSSLDLIVVKNTYFLSKQDLNMGKYQLFSKRMSGEVFQRVARQELKRFSIENFEFKGIFVGESLQKFKIAEHFIFFFACIIRAIKMRVAGRKVRYLLATDPQSSGVIAWLMSIILNSKLIVELNGNSGARKTWSAFGTNWVGHLKYHYCQLVIPFIMRKSYAVKLLYPEQLAPFKIKVDHPNLTWFHEYVPISRLAPSTNSANYILFLGMPWHVKGLDLLIKAFNKVCYAYDGHLMIVGYLSEDDRALIEKLIDGNEKIKVNPPVYYEEAQRFIHHCDFLVLPSRTEAMGRVLLEAMAHAKAVIGSSADGIPSYLINGDYGLIFENCDIDDLANKLLYMFKNPEEKKRFAENGRQAAISKYSEQAYLSNYLRLMKFEEANDI